LTVSVLNKKSFKYDYLKKAYRYRGTRLDWPESGKVKLNKPSWI